MTSGRLFSIRRLLRVLRVLRRPAMRSGALSVLSSLHTPRGVTVYMSTNRGVSAQGSFSATTFIFVAPNLVSAGSRAVASQVVDCPANAFEVARHPLQ